MTKAIYQFVTFLKLYYTNIKLFFNFYHSLCRDHLTANDIIVINDINSAAIFASIAKIEIRYVMTKLCHYVPYFDFCDGGKDCCTIDIIDYNDIICSKMITTKRMIKIKK